MSRNTMITIIASLLSLGVGLVIYLVVRDEEKKIPFKRNVKLAAKPGQMLDDLDKLDNSAMLSEGSQYGVQYYDQHKKI